MEDPANELYFSVAGAWEIAIKAGLGRLEMGVPFEAMIPGALDANAIELLPILPRHMAAVIRLPLHHRDPFDRMIVAQAVVEGAVLVTADAAMRAYSVPIVW